MSGSVLITRVSIGERQEERTATEGRKEEIGTVPFMLPAPGPSSYCSGWRLARPAFTEHVL